MTVAPERFLHEAVLYRDDAEFTAVVGGFVADGLSAGADVVVAEPPERISALREELGRDAYRVRFLDMHALGGNPARLISAWQSVLDANGGARPLRGVGEPVWVGRSGTEVVECQLHELLLNRAFDGGPAWHLICAYGASALDASVIGAVGHSHAAVVAGGASQPGSYCDSAATALFSTPLPPPPAESSALPFGPYDVAAVRELVAGAAAARGIGTRRAEELVLAAHEAATNSVRHGGGAGLVRTWAEPGALVVDFTDKGRIDDPLAGRLPTSLDREGGRGLYLVNHLCDFVQLRSGAWGTSVRMTTRTGEAGVGSARLG